MAPLKREGAMVIKASQKSSLPTSYYKETGAEHLRYKNYTSQNPLSAGDVKKKKKFKIFHPLVPQITLFAGQSLVFLKAASRLCLSCCQFFFPGSAKAHNSLPCPWHSSECIVEAFEEHCCESFLGVAIVNVTWKWLQGAPDLQLAWFAIPKLRSIF